MKAIVNTSALSRELKKLSQVINKNTVIPILDCVKMQFEKGKLTLMSTNLETTLVSSIECECKSPFIVIVEYGRLNDLCNNLPDEPITIEEKEKIIQVTGDSSKFEISKGGNDTEFPKIPEESYLFSVDVEEEFFTALYRADSCKNRDDAQVRINTACLDFKKGILSIVGTDALALYKKDLKVNGVHTSQSQVKGKFVDAIKHFQNGKLHIGEKFAKMESGNTSVITRLQDSKYCDYQSVLPAGVEYNFTASRIDLISSIRKAAVAAENATNLCAIHFVPDGVKILSEDVYFGSKGECRMRATHTVDIEAIGVNAKQLLHVLNLLDSEEVNMSITTPTRSVYFKQPNDNSVICILQPVLLNN